MLNRWFKSDKGSVLGQQAEFVERLQAKLASYLEPFNKENPTLSEKLYIARHRTGEKRARALLAYLEEDFVKFRLSNRTVTVLSVSELNSLTLRAEQDAIELEKIGDWDWRVMAQQHPQAKNKQQFVVFELKLGKECVLPESQARAFLDKLKNKALETYPLSTERSKNEFGELILSEQDKHLMLDIFYEVYNRQAALGNSTVLRRYVEAAFMEHFIVGEQEINFMEKDEIQKESAKFTGTVPVNDWTKAAKARARRKLVEGCLRKVGVLSPVRTPALEDGVEMQATSPRQSRHSARN